MPNSSLRLAVGVTTGAVGADRDDPAGVGCIQWRHVRIRVDGDPPGHASVDWVLRVARVACTFVVARHGGRGRTLPRRSWRRVDIDVGPGSRSSVLNGRLQCYLGERLAAPAARWL
jgi:hypothetical protein